MNNDKQNIRILLIGAGGYGKGYVDALCGAAGAGHAPYRVAGAVEPSREARAYAAERNIPLFDDAGAFYKDNGAELAIISTPIHLHFAQIIECLKNGSNVLCEKPLCVTLAEAREIERASAEAGRFVRVGYQLSFSTSVLALKNDILNGAFGKPHILKTIVHYPRGSAYYARNNWAGRKRTADGRLVLDSPLHNAVSHHINNMLFVLGGAADAAAAPLSVQAELYRGNPDVDNYDTAALRCEMENGAQILFYTSHSMPRSDNAGPICQYRFERASVVHTDEREHETFLAMMDDGTTRLYMPDGAGQMRKLWDCLEAARGGPLPPSGVSAAAQEVLCVNGAQLSHPIVTIPEEYIERTGEPGDRYTEVDGLERILFDCFNRNLLPSELEGGVRPPWTKAGKVVSAGDIRGFGFDTL